MSPDLVHWRHMPIALSPTDGSYDSYGTFTGSVLPTSEGASIVYTGTTKVSPEQETIRHEAIREVQCIATTTDPNLKTWHKLPEPVIEHPPASLRVTGFRDPFSWKEGECWYMGVGSGLSGVGGMVLLYRSTDARHWQYLHPLAEGIWNGETSSNPVPSGEMWECPDMFQLGSKHVLLYSSEGKTFWQTGTFDQSKLRFRAERSGLLDYGAYYAPKSMLDASGRRVLWGWIQETRPTEAITTAGWAGCMSLPRILSIGDTGELLIQIAPELHSIRKNTVEIKGDTTPDELGRSLDRVAFLSRSGYLELTFDVSTNPFSLQLYVEGADAASTILNINYDGNAHGFTALRVGEHTLPLSPDNQGRSHVAIWIDASVLELIVDRRYPATIRSYVLGAPAKPIRLRLLGSNPSLFSLTYSQVIPVSSDRLTT